MWAILSDIHANLEALQAVLADLGHQPEKIYVVPELENFLGDRLRQGR